MPFYKIYAGLGGFGGATFQGVEEHDNQEAAGFSAYCNACEQFESQEGLGMDGWEDFKAEAMNNLDYDDYDSEEEYFSAVEEYATVIENEAKESWIDYWAEETDDENFEE